MGERKKTDDDFVLTLGDLGRAIAKRKSLLICCMVIFSLLASVYTLNRSYRYTAEASFRIKENRTPNIGQSLLSFMNFGNAGVGDDTDAIPLMKSRKVLEEVARRLHLQGSVVEEKNRRGRLQRCKDNLAIEYALFRNRTAPLFTEEANPVCREISYPGETPLSFRLSFDRAGGFTVRTMDGDRIGSGTLGSPFYGEGYVFTLHANDLKKIPQKQFILSLTPLCTLAKSLGDVIKIEPDKKAKNILRITYQHPDRMVAMQVVDVLMQEYRNYLHKEHEENSKLQLNYLDERKEASLNQLVNAMINHAGVVSKDISTGGFFDTDVELKFLINSQLESIKKLNELELQVERLHTILSLNDLCLIQHYSVHSPSMTAVVALLQDLKQKSDTLSLLLRQNPVDQEKIELAFSLMVQDLHEVTQSESELHSLIEAIELGKPLSDDLHILKDPKLFINAWYQSLLNAIAEGNPKEIEIQKETCLKYLHNLGNQYAIHAKIITERLTHQYNPQQQYQGIDLETANALMIKHNEILYALEIDKSNSQFVLQQLEDPEFEISSLSSTLEDPVCKDIITKSYALSLTLRDQFHRSAKEQERVRDEIAMQHRFLTSHLQQNVKISQLNQDLTKDKITSLQEIILELLHAKISIFENQIKEYITAEISSLKWEKNRLEKFVDEIHQKMAIIPEKWVSEQLLKQKIEMNKASAEELTRLVEGKNISQNLEVIQSTTVDTAIAGILPDSPRLLLFAALGALIGAFISLSYTLVESIFQGVASSPENLRLAGKHVSGFLTRNPKKNVLDQDLSSLRQLIAYAHEAKTLLLLQGKGGDYSTIIASLFHKQGDKVLLLPLDCKECTPEKDLPGFLQYVEGKCDFPNVVSLETYDIIYPGSLSRFGIEYASSKKFHELLTWLMHRYDRIIAISSAPVESSEAFVLAKQFNVAAITLEDTPLTSIRNISSLDSVTFFFSV